MPALTNMSVGSCRGTSGALGTSSCPCLRKKSRNVRRISRLFTPLGLGGKRACGQGSEHDADVPAERLRGLRVQHRALMSRRVIVDLTLQVTEAVEREEHAVLELGVEAAHLA